MAYNLFLLVCCSVRLSFWSLWSCRFAAGKADHNEKFSAKKWINTQANEKMRRKIDIPEYKTNSLVVLVFIVIVEGKNVASYHKWHSEHNK